MKIGSENWGIATWRRLQSGLPVLKGALKEWWRGTF